MAKDLATHLPHRERASDEAGISGASSLPDRRSSHLGSTLGSSSSESRRTVTLVRPMTKLVPSPHKSDDRRAEPSRTPFFEPKSETSTPLSPRRMAQCRELTAGSPSLRSAVGPLPKTSARPASSRTMSDASGAATSSSQGPFSRGCGISTVSVARSSRGRSLVTVEEESARRGASCADDPLSILTRAKGW
jgi:hypothetical protein